MKRKVFILIGLLVLSVCALCACGEKPVEEEDFFDFGESTKGMTEFVLDDEIVVKTPEGFTSYDNYLPKTDNENYFGANVYFSKDEVNIAISKVLDGDMEDVTEELNAIKEEVGTTDEDGFTYSVWKTKAGDYYACESGYDGYISGYLVVGDSLYDIALFAETMDVMEDGEVEEDEVQEVKELKIEKSDCEMFKEFIETGITLK